MARVFSGALLGISVALYVAAKIHFFMRYDPLGIGTFIREHSIYWAGMAVTSFLIWLIEKRLSQDRL